MDATTPLVAAADGSVASRDGWRLRPLGPDLIEYECDRAMCLVNVGWSAAVQRRAIFASESCSALFPRLAEHLRAALPLLPGRYEVL